MKTHIETLKRHQFEVLWTHQQRANLIQIGIKAEQTLPVLTYLKTHTPFVQLTHYSAVDWIEDNEFQLTYTLTNPQTYEILMVCARIDREAATADSLHKLWPQAVTYEHEMGEMFGLKFPGSPRVGEPFNLEGWRDMPPMRRDFDTVKFVRDSIPERPGRQAINTRDYIGAEAGEKRLLHD
ncbi:NADH-quinone oxidoreductase subunit C [Myxococcota bacterium]|nr:NADH-quinone oxidoreductase subunit C [Myxococcota bacterium]MBU1431164.1 NADH-quinone oxidoreductase subunit C [Myxococcota bacterium]MBU1896649.1 NADH-quinone oxidoreductase subunit C [Myxococcota bacterium]